MKNDDYELIRQRLRENKKYPPDIYNLTIGEIIALIHYNKHQIEAFGPTEININNFTHYIIVFVLEEYLEDFNAQFGNCVKNAISA